MAGTTCSQERVISHIVTIPLVLVHGPSAPSNSSFAHTAVLAPGTRGRRIDLVLVAGDDTANRPPTPVKLFEHTTADEWVPANRLRVLEFTSASWNRVCDPRTHARVWIRQRRPSPHSEGNPDCRRGNELRYTDGGRTGVSSRSNGLSGRHRRKCGGRCTRSLMVRTRTSNAVRTCLSTATDPPDRLTNGPSDSN